MSAQDLQKLLDRHGIRYFSVQGDHRLLSPVKRRGRGVVVPSQELWPNIIPTLQCADIIRDALGMPVTIISGYRTVAYDRNRGRTNKSQHHDFRALDLMVPSVHYPRLKSVAQAVMDGASLGGMPTGFGFYDEDLFVHIDTHKPNSSKRRWS